MEVGAYNRDDDMLEATGRDGESRLRVYRPEATTVVLGRGSKADVELKLVACQEDSIPIVRRHGGGCAVLLDPGNVVVSVTLPAPGFGRIGHCFQELTAWLVGGLEQIGLPGVRHAGISDLALRDRKVGGACMYRTKDLLFYTTTLLVTPDLEAIERYLEHPPREPAYRRGRSHRDFLTTAARSPGVETAEQLESHLSQVLEPPHL